MSEKPPKKHNAKEDPDECWNVEALKRLLEKEGYSGETGHREGVRYTDLYATQPKESKQPGKLLEITTIINNRPMVYRFQYSPDPDDPDNEEWNPIDGFPEALQSVFEPRRDYGGVYLFNRDDEMESLFHYCAQRGISVDVVDKNLK